MLWIKSEPAYRGLSMQDHKMKTIKNFLIFLSFFSVLLTVPFSGFAQSLKDEAKRHYDLANDYYSRSKYKEAQEEFKIALDLTNAAAIEEKASLKKAKKQGALQKAQKQGDKKPALPAAVSKKTSEYVIGEDDVLYITVWQNKDLDQEVVVRPDGMISFPLIGDMPVVGLTVPELDSQLTQRLAEYVKYPDVSVSVRKIGGKKIIVLGEVESPGLYELDGKSTLLDAIALAKGFTTHAVVSSVIIIRGGLKKPKGIRINLNRVLLKAELSQNLLLKPEDIIFVPKKFVANVNYLVNQIVGPIAQGFYTTEALGRNRK